MPKADLEAQLADLTHEFVAKLVNAIRNASFADVAALSASKVPRGSREARAPKAVRGPGAAARIRSSEDGGRARQTAARRAELGERIVRTLRGAGRPLGVRALSGELGVAPDLLATPLRELRVAGQIQKHGEKRATTYSPA